MASIFTRIIEGTLPGRFVWRDDVAVGFLSISPLRPGHVLVVPRQEVDHWIDLDDGTAAHLMTVSRAISRAIQAEFKPVKVGLMIAGLEVPHVHIHLVPINDLQDLNFENQDPNATAVDLDGAAERIREALHTLGYGQASK